MAAPVTTTSVANVYRLLGLKVPSEATLTRIAGEITAGRTWTDLRDDLIAYQANAAGQTPEQWLQNVIRGYFTARGATIATQYPPETEQQRLARITQEVLSGQRTLSEVRATINTFAVQPGGTTGTPPLPPVVPPTQPPPPPPPPNTPPPPPPPVDTIDYAARVAALYPWLPGPLASKFASLWASSGDANLALAELRQDDLYETYYPGIRRPDGTLRMSEAEYASSKEAYSNLLAGYGLNPSQFSSWYTRWIEGEKSPQEVAAELGATYEGLVANIPEVRQYYAERWGIDMSDQAIFASILDSDVAAGILSRRIAVAQIGGEGLARGFDVADPFAERLAAAGIDQGAARGFFSEAEGRLPSLDEMARRFRDPDSTFDLEEFADAAVFGGAAQTSRIRRLLASEQSLFTDQTGGLAMNNELGVTGLRAI